MNRHWESLDLDNLSVFIFRYEDLLVEPESSFRTMVRKLKLIRQEGDFVVPENKMMAGQDRNITQSDQKFSKEFYSDQVYREWFDESELAMVRRNLDVDLLKRYDYEF